MELIAALLIIGVLLLLALIFMLTVSLIGFFITLVVAGLIGWAADRVTPGELPYGVLGAVGAGLLGAFVGGILMKDIGPSIAGLAIIPTFVGAVIVAIVAELAFGRNKSRGVA